MLSFRIQLLLTFRRLIGIMWTGRVVAPYHQTRAASYEVAAVPRARLPIGKGAEGLRVKGALCPNMKPRGSGARRPLYGDNVIEKYGKGRDGVGGDGKSLDLCGIAARARRDRAANYQQY